jgi:hypothetical protein
MEVHQERKNSRGNESGHYGEGMPLMKPGLCRGSRAIRFEKAIGTTVL